MSRRLVSLLFVMGFATSWHCSDTCPDSGKQTGDEQGPCYPDTTCNAGLVCLSSLCVRPADAQPARADRGLDHSQRPDRAKDLPSPMDHKASSGFGSLCKAPADCDPLPSPAIVRCYKFNEAQEYGRCSFICDRPTIKWSFEIDPVLYSVCLSFNGTCKSPMPTVRMFCTPPGGLGP
jgi:hypothetical protein